MTQSTAPVLELITSNPEYLAFVANQLEIIVPLPFEFATGHLLMRADSAQIEMIKRRLQLVVSPNNLAECYSRYECETIVQDMGNGARQISKRQLEPDAWRYYLVRTPSDMANLETHFASSVSRTPLDLVALGFRGDNGSMGWGYRQIALAKYYGSIGEVAPQVGEAELREISDVYHLWQSVTSQDTPSARKARRAVEMLDEIALLPHGSSFYVLGLFAILELLITHNPTLTDKGDSITHQVKTKIPLLMKRFDIPIDTSQHFGECKSDTIWSQLYGYRSAIAHGGRPDFSDNQKQGRLVSAENAQAFLQAVVRALIRNYFREPILYDDLSKV